MTLFEPKEEPGARLEELERRKTALMEKLASLAEEQRRLVAEVRKIEKEQRKELEGVQEYIAEEPLSHRDVELWARSVFFVFARTMPANPHMYVHTRWSDRVMFERMVRFIRAHGYDQKYGGAVYRCLDVELWSGRFFLWTMGAPVEETILINAKPHSLRPEEGA